MSDSHRECYRVWILDDNKEFLEDLTFALRIEGWKVFSYNNQDSFLEELSFDEPGCILLDVKMPGLSGNEIQELLISKNCPLPIIFLTGHGDMNLAIHSFRNGAFDFIQKPFDPEYLMSTIERAIQFKEKEHDAWLRESPVKKFGMLTYRQKQVLLDLSKGLSSYFVAEHLNISVRTVERHRQNGMRLCGVKTIEELKAFIASLNV